MSTELISIEESRRLVELEEVIEKGIGTFIKVGEALAEIRDKKLYRRPNDPKYTFEDYCREEWQMSRTMAFDTIKSAQAALNVRNCERQPRVESQARPLTVLKQPEQQRSAWSKAVESANGAQPTAKQVEAAVEEVRAEAEPEAPKRERAFQPSNGMQYAALAIENLKKIQPNDTERDKAYMAVQRFLTQNYQAK